MDWNKLKAEYVAGGISYRELAKKHGVSFSTLRNIAIREKWTELREQARNKAVTKLVDSIAKDNAAHTVNIYDVADKLLGKIESLMMEETLTIANIKDLTSAIKNIKEIKGVKSDIDLREQEARIDKLRKEVEEEKKDTNITITFGDEVKQYGV